MIDLRKVNQTCRPITLTLRKTTIARLHREVAKGSWSKLIDQAINQFLDKQTNQKNT